MTLHSNVFVTSSHGTASRPPLLMWDFVWLIHRTVQLLSYGHREDLSNIPGYEKYKPRCSLSWQCPQCPLSSCTCNCKRLSCPFLLLWRVRSTGFTLRVITSLLLEGPKMKEAEFPLFQSLQQMSVTSQQSHTPRQSRKWVRRDGLFPYHRPALRVLYSPVENHLEVMLQLYKLLIKKIKKNPSPSFQPGGRFHTKKTTQ